ncbi:transcriptional activator Mut3p [Fusarium napiforme]|uniref:Transcriptional activator Mut3p n=1 Tax=Fusarium napiforme TaxID=42672 RepID=A0A8H5JR61_9HYPO|nr:transcriptional activator Mut3p [Fusarium napiforme]
MRRLLPQADSATSRKATIRKQPNSNTAALQSQVQSLETSLDEAQQRIKELEERLTQKGSSQIDQPQQGGYDVSYSGRNSLDSGLELPPQHEVLSGVNKFLATFNTILPLLHPQRLLSRVNVWYEQPHQRDTSTWAAINVVLSLAYRHIPDEEKPPNYSTLHFMNKAQSVLNDIMLGDSNLLDVQTIVGMVVLLQATSDLKPASALIPIALRLAHGLGLHTRSGSEYLSSSEALERDRVFWIAYILDRDISMRTKLPPIQSQNDISIDWPSATPADGAGMLYTADNSSSFNFFVSRVQLAHIQGQVYEAMLSKSPTASDVYVRLDNVARIHQMLDDWLTRIPFEFSPSAITQSGNANLQRAYGVLYSSHLTCRSVVCKAHAMEAQWIPSLQDFGRKAIEQGVVAAPRLPVGWHKLVHESREYIELFVAIDRKDPAFICLFNPWHTKTETDDQLINPAFNFLDDIILQAPLPQLKRLLHSWDELLRNSREMSFRKAVQNVDWLEATCS